MIIITPLPQIEFPKPNSSECSKLLPHVDSMISGLEEMQRCLDSVSSEPDTAILAIKGQIQTMLSEANDMKTRLNTIKNNASQKAASAQQFKV